MVYSSLISKSNVSLDLNCCPTSVNEPLSSSPSPLVNETVWLSPVFGSSTSKVPMNESESRFSSIELLDNVISLGASFRRVVKFHSFAPRLNTFPDRSSSPPDIVMYTSF